MSWGVIILVGVDGTVLVGEGEGRYVCNTGAVGGETGVAGTAQPVARVSISMNIARCKLVFK